MQWLHIYAMPSAVKFASLYLLLWRYFEMTSDRLFSRLSPLCIAISNFSFKQRFHRVDIGLYDEYLPSMIQVIFGVPCRSLTFHNSFESSVSFLYRSLAKVIFMVAVPALKIGGANSLIYLFLVIRLRLKIQPLGTKHPFPSISHQVDIQIHSNNYIFLDCSSNFRPR